MFKNLYLHRRFLLGSFWSEFRFRYAGSVLGIFWFIVNPILEAAVYSFIFTYLIGLRSGSMRGDSYTLFLLVGLFPWLSFSAMLMHGSNSLNTASIFLRRLSVSTDVYVAKESLVAMLSLLIYEVILLPINLILGGSFSWSMLILPIIIFLFVALGFGMALTLSHLRVFFPDIGEILGVVVQLWRWTLPINFSIDLLPEWARNILKFNPPYFFITSFRGVFLDGAIPSTEAWMNMVVWVIIFVAIGNAVARKLGSEVKDQM